MSQFFVVRPILAWVLAAIIMLIGIVSITRLPIARYPSMAPPSVQIDAVYPGASARATEDSLTQVIEQYLTNLDGLLYIASSSDSAGQISIKLTFANGTNPDTAQVQVQNKVQEATPLLPAIVQQQGVRISKARPSYVEVIAFLSEDGRLGSADISDYLATNLSDRLARLPGVGTVTLFGSKYAMRIWLDADKLKAYELTPADITAAVQAQNAQIAVGAFGDLPAVSGQQLNATITGLGRLHTPEQFRDIVLRSGRGGSTLHLSDVARIELGPADYRSAATFNGRPASGFGITLAPNANALATAQGIESLLTRLQPQFPPGLHAVVPYDVSGYVRKSITEVVKTLGEAIVLVFLVMWVFLRDLRATLIPTIVVPVAVLGTFPVLLVCGFSINLLTLFAIVLAIGLLVDDAIVVVENVIRLMKEEALAPAEATIRSMTQITSALIGIAAVLAAVFVPMAFLPGSSGILYRQFSITIVSAMVLSVFVAITLTPALCATLLKPIRFGEQEPSGIAERCMNYLAQRAGRYYRSALGHVLGHARAYFLIYLLLVGAMLLVLVRLPGAFLPDEDEGYLFTLVQGPIGATAVRTQRALDQVRAYFLQQTEAVISTFQIAGFNFGGAGQNAGFGFVVLKDWSKRQSAGLTIDAIQQRAREALSRIRDAQAFVLAPPPNDDLGDLAGFELYLKDDDGRGHQALIETRDRLLSLAGKDTLLVNVRPGGQEDAPQFRLDIDPQRVAAFGLSMADVNDVLAVAWAGRYIGDFIDRGRLKRVIIQGDAAFRMVPENFERWFVRNESGAMVSIASLVNSHWESAPSRLERYNGVAALNITGQAARGVSSGQALDEIERLAAQLPRGYSVEFTGQSYEERAAGAQAPILYTASLITVFLCLSALYESWSLPTAILLAVPLGLMGAVAATAARGLERDVYFQVALLTTMGLTSKNAILVVGFAKDRITAGQPLIAATISATLDRMRPILMTSLAFGFGVLPLAMARGAAAGARCSIGTGVLGGMLGGTFLGIFLIPLLFVMVERVFRSPSDRPEIPSERMQPD